MWKYKTPGIPDDQFLRTENVPITKEEIRAVQISKARLLPGKIVYDVGCGSGSITVEAALQVESSGKVFSIDFDQDAIKLTRKNLEKFGLTNVSLIHGNALEKIPSLPVADTIFIGGTGGDTNKILELCESKLKSGGRIVIGIILLETLNLVLSLIRKLKFTSIDIIQVIISKSRDVSTGTMMLARNPVFVISASKV